MLLPLCCILFVACTSEYDADTAESNYKPITGKQMVASVKTSESVDGRDYVWEHQFSYDAKGRIKSVKSDVKSYRAVEYDNATDYLEYTALSTANSATATANSALTQAKSATSMQRQTFKSVTL